MGLEEFMRNGRKTHDQRVREGMQELFEVKEVGATKQFENLDPDMTNFDPLHQLIWDLRDWGFPITQESIDYLIDYLEDIEKSPEEVDYKIVAQALDQRHEELEFDTNNVVEKEGPDPKVPSPYS